MKHSQAQDEAEKIHKLLSRFKSIKQDIDSGWYVIFNSKYKLYYGLGTKKLFFTTESNAAFRFSFKTLEQAWSDLPEEFKSEVIYHLDVLK
jgi:hypothetical protein